MTQLSSPEFRGRIYGDITETMGATPLVDWGSPWSVCRPPRPNLRGASRAIR
jgi:hypothetical protein